MSLFLFLTHTLIGASFVHLCATFQKKNQSQEEQMKQCCSIGQSSSGHPTACWEPRLFCSTSLHRVRHGGAEVKGGERGEGDLAPGATQHRLEPEVSVLPELDLINLELRNNSLFLCLPFSPFQDIGMVQLCIFQQSQSLSCGSLKKK